MYRTHLKLLPGLLGWVVAGLLAAGAGPAAAPAFHGGATEAARDPDATLVLFGGFGHLDGRAQPRFQELLAGKTDHARSLYRELNIGMNETLREVAGQEPPGRLSSYPIAVTNEDVKAALGRRLGRPVSDADVDDLAAHFDRILVLVLASSLEMEKVFSHTTPVGTRHQNIQILGVSALLVSATTGDIVFMVPLLRQDSTDLGEARPRTLAETVHLYADAGRWALRRFHERLLQSSPPGNGKRRKPDPFAWDAYMVTDYRLHESAGELFASRPLNGGRCRDEDDGCQGLAALLEYAMTEAIANAGRPVLPPVRASEWGRSAELRIGLTLRSNQAVLGTDRLTLRVPAAAATHRVTARLTGVGSFDQATASEVVTRRVFIAGVAAEVEDLGGQSRDLVKEVRNSGADRQIEALRVAGAPELSRDAERAFYSMAILSALEEVQDAMVGR